MLSFLSITIPIHRASLLVAALADTDRARFSAFGAAPRTSPALENTLLHALPTVQHELTYRMATQRMEQGLQGIF